MTIYNKALSDGLSGELGVNGNPAFRFGADTSGQLIGFRNILINGNMVINQRGVTIAAAANGAYGPDRWKKVDASNMTQIVEAGNFVPNAVYTLSGTNVTTQQITSPASGHWTIPNVPITATNVQLEAGSIATPFEQRPIGLELSLCQRYYISGVRVKMSGTATNAHAYGVSAWFTPMRVTPSISNYSQANSGLTTGGATANGNNSIFFEAAVSPGGAVTANMACDASAEL